MNIRPVVAADFDAIAEITNHYIRTTPIHFGYEDVTAAELRGSWEKVQETHPFFVAIDDSGAVVAYAKAAVWRERAAYFRTAEVGLYVRHDLRGQGIGFAIYNHLIEACIAAGFHSLVGGVTMPNDASVTLHERCGFVHTGTFQQVGWKYDAWHDVAFFQRLL